MKKYEFLIMVILALVMLAGLFYLYSRYFHGTSDQKPACGSGEAATFEGGAGWTCVKKGQIVPMD